MANKKKTDELLDRKSEFAVCPFFEAKGNNMIMCEGIMNGTQDKHIFDEPKRRVWHYARYCCVEFYECQYAKLLIDKYERKDLEKENGIELQSYYRGRKFSERP